MTRGECSFIVGIGNMFGAKPYFSIWCKIIRGDLQCKWYNKHSIIMIRHITDHPCVYPVMFADHQCVYCSVHKINFLCKTNIEIISLGKHSHRRSSTFVLSCSVHNINGSIMSVAVSRKSMNCKLEWRQGEHKIDCATSQIVNVCTLMFCAKPILRSYRRASIQSFMMRHIADHQRL